MDVAEAGQLTGVPGSSDGAEVTPGKGPPKHRRRDDDSWEELPPPWRTAVGVALALAVAIGIVLRFWTRSALWLDEALTVDIARLPLHDLHAALKRDGAPPLYYVLLHFWMKVFGDSDLGVRSLSGVLGVLTLPIAWLGARRYGGRRAAWVVLALLATAPFAIYYATEARMYGLVIFLTACGFLALDRAMVRARPGNLVAVAVCTAGLLYSQYWAIYLIGTVGLWLLFQSIWGRSEWRRQARWALGAVVVGVLAFVPWIPTFLYQSKHTGTPWAAPPNFAAIINAVTGFTDNQATLSTAGSNQGRLLALGYFVLAGLGLFGVARDRWHVDLDLRTRVRARSVAFVTTVTLAVAVTGGIITKSAFTPRYAAVVFLPLLLLVGLGSLTLADARIRVGLVAIISVAGLAAGVENVNTQRTQATQVANVLAAHAAAGDVVAFCPDQLGPAVYRQLPTGRYQLSTFPRRTSPAFVDWVDYKSAAHAASPSAYAQYLERLAGNDHAIWLTWAPGYQGFGIKCEQVANDLLHAPGYGGHQWVNLAPAKYYEPMNLTQFNPPGYTPPAGSTP